MFRSVYSEPRHEADWPATNTNIYLPELTSDLPPKNNSRELISRVTIDPNHGRAPYLGRWIRAGNKELPSTINDLFEGAPPVACLEIYNATGASGGCPIAASRCDTKQRNSDKRKQLYGSRCSHSHKH